MRSEHSLLARIERRLWRATAGEGAWIDRRCGFRERERHGRVFRPNYAYGMLRGADVARYFGHTSATIIEFGVAGGAGLLNMVALAPEIEKESGVKLRIVGFDTGQGLPSVEGFKDHPELWNPGDFTTNDRTALLKAIKGRAEIIWGDIGDTVGSFMDTVTAPICFISIDVDIYSATKSALRCLTCEPEKYTPAVSMYFDDVTFFFANRWAGELVAIDEFNSENQFRKIDRDRSLPGLRQIKADGWYEKMYVCHLLDHKTRQIPSG